MNNNDPYTRITITMPESMQEQLVELAKNQHRSVSAQVAWIISNHFSEAHSAPHANANS